VAGEAASPQFAPNFPIWSTHVSLHENHRKCHEFIKKGLFSRFDLAILETGKEVPCQATDVGVSSTLTKSVSATVIGALYELLWQNLDDLR
jgi:hypothetical protein